jgi:hypothetical protein
MCCVGELHSGGGLHCIKWPACGPSFPPLPGTYSPTVPVLRIRVTLYADPDPTFHFACGSGPCDVNRVTVLYFNEIHHFLLAFLLFLSIFYSTVPKQYTVPVARLSNPDSIAYPDPHEFTSSYLKDPDCGAYVWILPEIVKNNPVLANGVLRPNSWT